MKVSKQTMGILRNFSMIEDSINFNEAGWIKTINKAHSMIGLAKISEQFPNIGIYDLKRFIGVLSLLDGDELEFDFIGEDQIKITQSQPHMSINYRLADADRLLESCKPSEKYFADQEFACKFDLTAQQLMNLCKAGRVMGLKIVNFNVKDGVGTGKLFDEDNPLCDTFHLHLEGEGNCTNASIWLEDFEFLPGNYTVQYHADKKYFKFTNNDIPVTYICSAKRS